MIIGDAVNRFENKEAKPSRKKSTMTPGGFVVLPCGAATKDQEEPGSREGQCTTEGNLRTLTLVVVLLVSLTWLIARACLHGSSKVCKGKC